MNIATILINPRYRSFTATENSEINWLVPFIPSTTRYLIHRLVRKYPLSVTLFLMSQFYEVNNILSYYILKCSSFRFPEVTILNQVDKCIRVQRHRVYDRGLSGRLRYRGKAGIKLNLGSKSVNLLLAFIVLSEWNIWNKPQYEWRIRYKLLRCICFSTLIPISITLFLISSTKTWVHVNNFI